MSQEQKKSKLSIGRLLIWKSSDVTVAGIQAIILGFLTLYCTDTLGINPGTVGVVLLVSKIIDAFTDVAAGWLVDNTHSKWGKGRPYELNIIGISITTVALFAASPEWSTVAKIAWIMTMYTLQFSVFSTLRGAALTPYTIRAFSNNQEIISKVASYGGVISLLGAVVVNVAFPLVLNRLATSATGWTFAVAIFTIPLTLIGILRFLFIKEDPSIDAGNVGQKISIKEILTMLKNNKYVWFYAFMMLFYNVMTALGVASYYFKWIIGDVGKLGIMSAVSIIVLPMMFTYPIILRKMGSPAKMIQYFCLLGCLGEALKFVSNTNFIGILVGTAISSIATLPIAYYGILFIMRCCSYNEMIDLPRMDSSTNILASFASKFGSAFGSALTGILLGMAGYVAGADVTTQSDSALWMIRILFAGVPILLLLGMSFFAGKFAPLEKEIVAWEMKKQAAE